MTCFLCSCSGFLLVHSELMLILYEINTSVLLVLYLFGFFFEFIWLAKSAYKSSFCWKGK